MSAGGGIIVLSCDTIRSRRKKLRSCRKNYPLYGRCGVHAEKSYVHAKQLYRQMKK